MAASARISDAVHRYLIALGSNRRHMRHGPPRVVIRAALRSLTDRHIAVIDRSRVIESAPLGPSIRRYANAAAIVETHLEPHGLLRELKKIERDYGRRQRGQRWSARVLDLDIILWSGGTITDTALSIPHREYRKRDFVLRPAQEVAPNWRDPITGLTIRQLAMRSE